MNAAAFKISLNEVEKLLSEMGLFKMRGVKSLNNDGVSDEFKSASQEENYLTTHHIGLEKYDFDFLLFDDSFMQFEFKLEQDKYEVRFAYFQNPAEFKTYENFLQNEIDKGTITETIEEIGDLLFEEYTQFLNELDFHSNYTVIRYDADFPNYTPLIHSTSHLHIGYNNHIRIPIDKILTPIMFTVFVIKHVYYFHWKKAVEANNKLLLDTLRTMKSSHIKLSNAYWDVNVEGAELFIC